jgi:hypothetical protein
MILKKLFTSCQFNAGRMNDVFDEILVNPYLYDEHEIRHLNLYTNRLRREKIWKIEQRKVCWRGQDLISRLCGDDQVIDSVLKTLTGLQESLEFDESFFR